MKWNDPAVAILVAVFLGLFVWYHAPAFSFYFSQDDFPLLATSHPGWVSPLKFFTFGSEIGYRPLTQHYFFYLNQLLFDLNPRGHHAMNLFVHGLSSLLVAALAWRWLGIWTALPAAFIFALHPSHFYEVFWVSGISQGGYVFFLLLSIVMFSEYHRRRRLLFLVLSALAASAAFLSKEDAVTLPAILTLVAILEPGQHRSFYRRLLSTLPYWLLLGGYFWLRFGILGFGLPKGGVYQFGFDGQVLLAKLNQYSRWIFINNWFLTAFLLLGVWCLLVLFRRSADRQGSDRFKPLILFPAMAAASVFPTLFVPSSAEHYLSFSTAALALLVSSFFVHLKNTNLRNWLAFGMAGLFLFSSHNRQEVNLTDRSLALAAPIPFKAAWCEKWVDQLRREQPPSDPGCTLLFRDIPLQEWEKAWFIFLPMIAWNRPFPKAVAHIAGTPEPQIEGSCMGVWSFASSDAKRLQ